MFVTYKYKKRLIYIDNFNLETEKKFEENIKNLLSEYALTFEEDFDMDLVYIEKKPILRVYIK